MEYSNEIDWLAAWYLSYGVWDSTINFWITATFAVLVAVHALGDKATLQITRPIAMLYGAFSIYTILRAIGIYGEASRILEIVTDPSIDLFANGTYRFGYFADYLLWAIYACGSIYTTYFVATAHKRNE